MIKPTVQNLYFCIKLSQDDVCTTAFRAMPSCDDDVTVFKLNCELKLHNTAIGISLYLLFWLEPPS